MRRPFELQAAPECEQQHSLAPQPDPKMASRSTVQEDRKFFGQTFATVAVDSVFDLLRRPERTRVSVRVMQPPTTTLALPHSFNESRTDTLPSISSAGRKYSTSALHVTLQHLEKSASSLTTPPTYQHVPGIGKSNGFNQFLHKINHLTVQTSHSSLPTLSSFGLRYELTDSSTDETVLRPHGMRGSCSPLPCRAKDRRSTSDHQALYHRPDALAEEPSLSSSALHGKHIDQNRLLDKPAHLPDLPASTMRVPNALASSPWPTASSPLPTPLSQAHVKPHILHSIPASHPLAHTNPLQTKTASTQSATQQHSHPAHQAHPTITANTEHTAPSLSPLTNMSAQLSPPRPHRHGPLPDVKHSGVSESTTRHADGMSSTVSAVPTTQQHTKNFTGPEDGSRKSGRCSDHPWKFFGHLQTPSPDAHTVIDQPAITDPQHAPDAPLHAEVPESTTPVKEHVCSSVKPEDKSSPTSIKSSWQETVQRLSMPSVSQTHPHGTSPSNPHQHPDPNPHSVPAPWPQTLARSLHVDEHRRRPPHVTLNCSAAPEAHTASPASPCTRSPHSLDGSPTALSRESSYSTSVQQESLSPSVSYNGSFAPEEDAPHSSGHSFSRRVILALPEGSGGEESQSDSDDGGSGDESPEGQIRRHSKRAGGHTGKHKVFISNLSRFKQASVRDPTTYAPEIGKYAPNDSSQSISDSLDPSFHAPVRPLDSSHHDHSHSDRNTPTHLHTSAFRPMHAPRVHGEDYTNPDAVDYDFDTGSPLEMVCENVQPSGHLGRNSYAGYAEANSLSAGQVSAIGPHRMTGKETLLHGPRHAITTGSIIRRQASMRPMRSAVGGTSFSGGHVADNPPIAMAAPSEIAVGLQINTSLAVHRAYLDSQVPEPVFIPPPEPPGYLSPRQPHRSYPGNSHHHHAQPDIPHAAVGFSFSPRSYNKAAWCHAAVPPIPSTTANQSSDTQPPSTSTSGAAPQQQVADPVTVTTSTALADPVAVTISAALAAIPLQEASYAPDPSLETPVSPTISQIQIHTPPPNRLNLLIPDSDSASSCDILTPASPITPTPLVIAAAAASAQAATAAATDLAAAAAALVVPDGSGSPRIQCRRAMRRNNLLSTHLLTPEEVTQRKAEQEIEKTRTKLEELEAERVKVEAVDFARRAQKHFQSSFPKMEVTEKVKRTYCHFTQSMNYNKWVLHRADLVSRALDHNNQIMVVGNNAREDAAGADVDRQIARVFAMTDND